MLADFVQSGLSAWWAPVLAFAAGVVSFASPCVFPLVPGYLSFVAGTQDIGPTIQGSGASGAAETAVEAPPKPIVPILLFISGFAIVFTLLGAFSGVFVPLLRSNLGMRLAGIVVLLFGVAMMLYAFRLGRPSLYAERRPFLSRVKPGPAGAVPLGMAFAAGWTPCIGPVLGTVLVIAGAEGGWARGAFLLFVYSLGLGVPFLLVGLGISKLVRTLDWIKRNYRAIAGVSGAIMITIGLLLISGAWLRVMAPVLQWTRNFIPPL